MSTEIAGEKANKAKTPKETKPEVITGTALENNQIAVNKKDVIRVKSGACAKYGLKPWNHIAKRADQTAIVYVWDSREIVAQIDASTIADEDLLKSVKDSGKPLQVTENTPEGIV